MAKVAIIGRTNVGKSTLFNRLISSQKAIVSPIPGTTRDRNFGECSWNGRDFTLIDTGGLEDPDYKRYSSRAEKMRLEEIEINVKKQALVALKQADSIVFVIDIKTGILPQDREIVKILRQAKKPVILAVNKADAKRMRLQDKSEYYKLGLGEPILISATSGSGTGDLLDEITKNLPKQKEKKLSTISPESHRKDQQLTISIIGRPNVGKSSLLNYFTNEERAITSAQPHTTREAQEINLDYNGYKIKLVDTAGVRRQAKIDDSLEKIGVHQALDILRKSDIIIFMLDASENISKQDQALARLIKEIDRPTVIVINKWDLVKGVEMSVYEKYLKRYFHHLSFSPIVFASCKTKRNLDQILDTVLLSFKNSTRRIAPKEMDDFLNEIMEGLKKYESKIKKTPRLIDIKQTGVNPLSFEIIMKASRLYKPHPSTIKYVENRLREKFNFKNVPIQMSLRTVKVRP